MKTHSFVLAATAVAFALALTACNAPGTGASVASAAAPGPLLAGAATANLAGEFKGHVKDPKFGKGTIKLELSQSGTSAGGSLVMTFPTTSVGGALAGTVSSSALSANQIVLFKNPCTFTLNATYAASTLTLKGTYTPSNRCSGETGHFTALEKCYYVVPPAINAVVKPNTTAKAC